MFRQTATIRIYDTEAIEFCRVLGMYGLKFDISEVRDADETNPNKKVGYRIFTFTAPERKIRELYGEFSMIRDGQFKFYENNRGSA